jgi:hypothetical protein
MPPNVIKHNAIKKKPTLKNNMKDIITNNMDKITNNIMEKITITNNMEKIMLLM